MTCSDVITTTIVNNDSTTASVTLLPWAKGKPLAWYVTVPDTYADLHLTDTATMAGVAADKAATNHSRH